MQLLTLKRHDMGYSRWSYDNAVCTHMIDRHDGFPRLNQKRREALIGQKLARSGLKPRVSHTEAVGISFINSGYGSCISNRHFRSNYSA